MNQLSLPEKIVALHRHLAEDGLPHAFGGALALAWCTQQARGTIDIDVNVFVGVDQLDRLLSAFPEAVTWTDDDVALLRRDGQARLRWGETPVDVFLDTTDFHRAAATRCRVEAFAGADVPFLSCADIAVFKAFFGRTKDWADLEAMADAGTLDIDRLTGVLVDYLGGTDPRIARVQTLRS
ncbi:MAG: hypothetical protein JWO77_475 [Ilumatobacteraceae bacterium]|nr:hypothetical protein [Ilumatobacteraceae bacterium]